MKNFGQKGEWAYPGTVEIFWVPPIILGTGKATDFKFGQYIQRVHPKPIKNFRQKGAWAYPGTAQFFRVPPIISGTWKATDFKFCTRIYRLNRNKSPLKIREW